jgi:hypothetical protein
MRKNAMIAKGRRLGPGAALLLSALALPFAAEAQGAPAVAPAAPVAAPAATAPAPAAYTTAQLDQMLAPIALYPDQLLTQILMASTYPLQVVEAERWLENPSNAALKGDALVAALKPLDWDPSVKSLVPFPQIVKMMNDQLSWMESLGEAFATQQAEVMARVQALRQDAINAGTLTSNDKMVVQSEGPDIAIAPANPDVVYVPVYDPAVVYGPWPYVAYPPVVFGWGPGFYVGPFGVGIGFSVGFGIVGPLWGFAGFDWAGGGVFVNSVAFNNISAFHTSFAGGHWHHQGPIGHGGFRGAYGGGHFAGGRGFAGHGLAGHGLAGHGGFRGGRAGGAHFGSQAHGFNGGRAGAQHFGRGGARSGGMHASRGGFGGHAFAGGHSYGGRGGGRSFAGHSFGGRGGGRSFGGGGHSFGRGGGGHSFGGGRRR